MKTFVSIIYETFKVISSIFLSFLSTGFIVWDLDYRNWTEFYRILFIGLTLIFMILFEVKELKNDKAPKHD